MGEERVMPPGRYPVGERRGDGPGAAVEDVGKLEALYSVFEGTSALFHRVGALIGRIHPLGEGAGGKHAILWELDGLGPRTVPQIARARPVSRQYVRHLVNQLLDEGWVELADNPAHKRSKLVRLTPRGEDFVGEIKRRDAELLGKLEIDIPEKDLRVAAGVLWSLRDILCGERAERLLEGEERRPAEEPRNLGREI